MIRRTTDYQFYDWDGNTIPIELKSIDTATPALSAIVMLNEKNPTFMGAEILLDKSQVLHAEWRFKVHMTGDEDAAGTGSTLKVEVLGSDSLTQAGELNSPQVMFGTGNIAVTDLVKGHVIYDGLIPQNFKANYLQLKLTVGTAKFTAGKLVAEAYAIRDV